MVWKLIFSHVCLAPWLTAQLMHKWTQQDVCRRSEFTVLVRVPTQVLMSWHNGFVSEVLTGNEHKGHLVHPKSVFVLQKRRPARKTTSERNCGRIFSFESDHFSWSFVASTKSGSWITSSRPCLCCRRDGPSIMGCESDCQQITAVERYGAVVLRKCGLCLSHVFSFCRTHAHSKHWPSSLFKFLSFIRWQAGQFPGIFFFCKGFHVVRNW